MRRLPPYVTVVVLIGALTAAWGGWHLRQARLLAPYVPPAVRHTLPDLDGEMRLVAIGDWGSGRRSQSEVAAAMEKTAAEVGGFHAGLLLGDNFYYDGVRSVDDPLFRRYFEEPYDTPHLAALPWYVVLGNHDYNGDTQAQILYEGRFPGHWNLPHEYYRVDLPDGSTPLVTILALDTNVRFNGWDAQMVWLEKELQELVDARQMVVVITHTPVVSYSTQRDRVLPPVSERVAPLLARYPVDLYLAGHAHCMEMIELDDLRVAVVGTGGKRLHGVEGGPGSVFHRSTFGFGVLRVRRGSLVLEFRDREGTVLHTWSRARAE